MLDFSNSLTSFLDALFTFISTLLNTIFTRLTDMLNSFDFSGIF